jgi:hypothetical protein
MNFVNKSLNGQKVAVNIATAKVVSLCSLFLLNTFRQRAKAGVSVESNLALSCQGCNNHKYNKTEGYDPTSGQITALFHPRQHAWMDHFVWNEDYSLIIGITPIGRATVDTLQLNRDGLVNLRRVLYQMGEHPPL